MQIAERKVQNGIREFRAMILFRFYFCVLHSEFRIYFCLPAYLLARPAFGPNSHLDRLANILFPPLAATWGDESATIADESGRPADPSRGAADQSARAADLSRNVADRSARPAD